MGRSVRPVSPAARDGPARHGLGVKQAIAEYDAAPSIADRKEAAVVAVERARMYLAFEEANPAPRRLRQLGDDTLA